MTGVEWLTRFTAELDRAVTTALDAEVLRAIEAGADEHTVAELIALGAEEAGICREELMERARRALRRLADTDVEWGTDEVDAGERGGATGVPRVGDGR